MKESLNEVDSNLEQDAGHHAAVGHFIFPSECFFLSLFFFELQMFSCMCTINLM